MDAAKMIQSLVYVRDMLNQIPITGIENCQRAVNATININAVIVDLTKEMGKDKPDEDNN